MDMTPETVFKQLTQFNSKDVLVINNYHGRYSSDRVRCYPTVIYTCFGEAFNHTEFEALIDSAPETRFIIITARKYLLNHADGKKCHVFYLPSAYGQYAEHIPVTDFDLHNKIFEKKFLSLNFRSQWSRQALAQFLVQTGLINDFYFSYHAHDRFGVGHQTLYDEINQIIGVTWFNQGLDLEEFYRQLPITTGLPDEISLGMDWWSFHKKEYWVDTFCSFVNETYIDENNDPFFTEKIFKPIAYGHPFLLFSSAGALKLLRELGIETFSDVFDESYDTIASPQQRFENLLREIRRICLLPEKQLNNIHHKLIPRLSNNQHIFRHVLPEIYFADIQKIIIKICAILQIKP